MTADEVIATVAAMPSADWLKIQAGLAEMVASRFSRDDVSEIRPALAEADAELARGDAMTCPGVRRHLGLAGSSASDTHLLHPGPSPNPPPPTR